MNIEYLTLKIVCITVITIFSMKLIQRVTNYFFQVLASNKKYNTIDWKKDWDSNNY